MSEQGVFDVLTAMYVVAFFLFVVGTIVWTVNRSFILKFAKVYL